MSFGTNIKTSFIRRKIASFSEPKTARLKKPEIYTTVLLVTNLPDADLLKEAALHFSTAEITSLFNRKEKEDHASRFHYSVHPSDFNLTGQLKNDKLVKLLQKEFDLVIDLSKDSVFLDFLVHQMKSNLLVGTMDKLEDPKYNLVCEAQPTNQRFLNEVIKQLKQFAQK